MKMFLEPDTELELCCKVWITYLPMHKERFSDFISIKITQTFSERKTSGPWKSGPCNLVLYSTEIVHWNNTKISLSSFPPLMSVHQEEGGLCLSPLLLCISITHTQYLRCLLYSLILFGQRIISDFFWVAHLGIHILIDQQAEQAKQTTVKFVVQPFVSIQPSVFLTAVETSHPWDLNNTKKGKGVKSY